MHRRLGSATLSQLAFHGESKPIFPWEKSHWDNTVVIFFFFLKYIFKKKAFAQTFSGQLAFSLQIPFSFHNKLEERREGLIQSCKWFINTCLRQPNNQIFFSCCKALWLTDSITRTYRSSLQPSLWVQHWQSMPADARQMTSHLNTTDVELRWTRENAWTPFEWRC